MNNKIKAITLSTVLINAFFLIQDVYSEEYKYHELYDKQISIKSFECDMEVWITEHCKAKYPEIQTSPLASGCITVQFTLENENYKIEINSDTTKKDTIIKCNDMMYINNVATDTYTISKNESTLKPFAWKFFILNVCRNFIMPLPAYAPDLYRFREDKESDNSYILALNTDLMINKARAGKEFGDLDKILTFNKEGHILTSRQKYPDKIMEMFSAEDLRFIFTNNESWDNYLEKENVYYPTRYTLHDLSSGDLLVEARISDAIDVKINRPDHALIKPPEQVDTIIKREDDYTPTPEWKKIVRKISKFFK